ncbi:MAG TPA: UDP-N-acetylmuramate--L-alanine ligase [Candidatus Saccharimonadales bacterium]|nr:UDP-N-acetylmuramate--L-alanine ligase [Candidatus Saccharimonadales bacterium]
MPKKNRIIYMIGIKGVGMTTLAQFLVARGDSVSGSDIAETFMTDKILARLKIKIKTPFSSVNLPTQADLIIHSIAYTPENNIEMKTIRDNPDLFKKTRVLTYSEALGEVFSAHQGIAVCGSHGKTTVSAWLGYVLSKSGKNPNVFVGSNVPQFKGGSLKGSGKIFVAEADEYGNKLKYLNPNGVVLNNIDYDHPDFFKTEGSYLKVFSDFIKRIPASGFLVTNHRDRLSRKIKKYCQARIINYDIADENYNNEAVDYLAHGLRIKNGYYYFLVNNLGEFKIRLWGKHNIYNALAVIAAARDLGVSVANIKKYLFDFRGTERRAQILGKYKGALIIDDYAHHPTEIKATLEGVRHHYPYKRLRVVFHPHTFTRTKVLFNDFVSSFKEAAELIILDIYGSAREKQGGVSSAQLVKAIKSFNKQNSITQSVSNLKNIAQVVNYLHKQVDANDLILLMGAGDVFRVAEELLCGIQKK